MFGRCSGVYYIFPFFNSNYSLNNIKLCETIDRIVRLQRYCVNVG